MGFLSSLPGKSALLPDFLRILGRGYKSFWHSSACLLLCHRVAWGQGKSSLETGTSSVVIVCIQLLAGSAGLTLWGRHSPGGGVSVSKAGQWRCQPVAPVSRSPFFPMEVPWLKGSDCNFVPCVLDAWKIECYFFCQGSERSEGLGLISLFEFCKPLAS